MVRQQCAHPQLSKDSGKGNSVQERHIIPGLGTWFGRESGRPKEHAEDTWGQRGLPTMFNREHQAWWAVPGCAQPGRGKLHCKVPQAIHKCPDLSFRRACNLEVLKIPTSGRLRCPQLLYTPYPWWLIFMIANTTGTLKWLQIIKEIKLNFKPFS